jgi:hypothetical protein
MSEYFSSNLQRNAEVIDFIFFIENPLDSGFWSVFSKKPLFINEYDLSNE